MASIKHLFWVALGLFLALTIAACGSTSTGSGGSGGYGGNTNASQTPTTSASSGSSCGRYCTSSTPTVPATGSGLVIKTASATISGKSVTILTNAQGMTLYYRTSDSSSSVCSGNCASAWPPMLVTGSATPTGATSLSGQLSVGTNANGKQVEYNGHPLYTYSGDSAPGQTNGQGFGGVWFAVTTNLAPGGGSQNNGYGY
jgi:predicted lipoprotein with Yx(FWY)xxD motif